MLFVSWIIFASILVCSFVLKQKQISVDVREKVFEVFGGKLMNLTDISALIQDQSDAAKGECLLLFIQLFHMLSCQQFAGGRGQDRSHRCSHSTRLLQISSSQGVWPARLDTWASAAASAGCECFKARIYLFQELSSQGFITHELAKDIIGKDADNVIGSLVRYDVLCFRPTPNFAFDIIPIPEEMILTLVAPLYLFALKSLLASNKLRIHCKLWNALSLCHSTSFVYLPFVSSTTFLVFAKFPINSSFLSTGVIL